MIQTTDSSRLYVGNNSITVPYPVPFIFHFEEDLIVVVRDVNNVEETLVLGGDYSVLGEGDPNGGSITTTWPVPATSFVSIVRTVPFTQLTAYEEGDSFPAKSHERALDKLTMEVQQVSRGMGTGLGDEDDIGTAFRVTNASVGLNAVTKLVDTTLGVDVNGKAVLRLPVEMLNWMGMAGSAWKNDAERLSKRGAYPGQLGVQLDNWAIYEARSIEIGDWQPFLRFDGLVTSTDGVVGAKNLPAGEIVGTDESQILYNKTLLEPHIVHPSGLTPADVGLGNVPNIPPEDYPVPDEVTLALLAKQDLAEKAQPAGYASLDASGKIPVEQLPGAALSENQYQGTWNAATNTPTIPAAAPANVGWTYIVAVAGTTNVSGITSWAVGDHIISNGVVWQKVTTTQNIVSVNGKTGVVTVTKADVGLGNVENYSASDLAQLPQTLTNKVINGAANVLTVRLDASDTVNNLPVTKLNAGVGAGPTTWWCGDGSWKRPPGTGDVAGADSSVTGEVVIYKTGTGKELARYAGTEGFAWIKPNTPLATKSVHDFPEKLYMTDDDEFLVWDSEANQMVRVKRSVVGIPVGTILDFAGGSAKVPVGYLLCYGQIVLQADYADLFDVIGTAWNGVPSTPAVPAGSFRIPDLRGYLNAGKDDMGGTNSTRLNTMAASATTLGGSGGLQTHTLTLAQIPAHAHLFSDYYNPLQYLYPSGGLPPGAAYNNPSTTLANNTQNAGSSGVHNNIQPTRIVNKIIKY